MSYLFRNSEDRFSRDEAHMQPELSFLTSSPNAIGTRADTGEKPSC